MKASPRTPYILAVVLLIVAGVYGYTHIQKPKFEATGTSATPTTQQEEVHFHAAFRIYDGSVQRDFTAFDYMSVKPCGPSEEEENHAESEGSIEDFVHLHDLVGDIIHIHGPGITWGDVFKYVDVSETPEIVSGYNNSEFIEDVLNTPVEAYQSMTFFIGPEPDIATKQKIFETAPSKEYIEDIEKKSEACSS